MDWSRTGYDRSSVVFENLKCPKTRTRTRDWTTSQDPLYGPAKTSPSLSLWTGHSEFMVLGPDLTTLS